MDKWLARLSVGVASILLLGACATAGTRSDLMPTYVMIFTVPAGAFTGAIPHCSSDCSPAGFGPDEPIFLVEDVGFDIGTRQFSQYLYSPQWQQPDLDVARKWARCIVERFDKPDPDFGKITVTSAYLIRVLAPAEEVKRAQRASQNDDWCEVAAMKNWKMRR